MCCLLYVACASMFLDDDITWPMAFAGEIATRRDGWQRPQDKLLWVMDLIIVQWMVCIL